MIVQNLFEELGRVGTHGGSGILVVHSADNLQAQFRLQPTAEGVRPPRSWYAVT